MKLLLTGILFLSLAYYLPGKLADRVITTPRSRHFIKVIGVGNIEREVVDSPTVCAVEY